VAVTPRQALRTEAIAATMPGMTSALATARTAGLAALAAAVLCACTAWPQPPSASPRPPGPAAGVPEPAGLPRYRCDHDLAFTVQQGEDAVTIDAGPRGREQLLRDAGGLTPRQSVYSSAGLRAEFGLGAGGNEAVLRYAEPPLVVHCVRE